MHKTIRFGLTAVRSGLVLLFVASFTVVTAKANIVYTYQGLDMVSRSDQSFTPCPTPCRVTVYLTLSTPLPANFAGTLSPTAISMTDGTLVLDNTNSNVSASVDTNAQGNIAGFWAIELDAFDQHHQISTIYAPGNLVRDLTFNFVSQVPPGQVYEAYNFNTPGSWTMSQSTPEPGTIGLFGSGLFAALGYLRRRLL